MNRISIIFTTLILSCQCLLAQTYYYRFTKIINKGISDTNVSGGQFITFDGKKCFESDKFGNDVGNGGMAYDSEMSQKTRLRVYWGTCYWGKNAYFKFNSDKTLLNVETNTGKVYVYKKSAPPSNVTTCSLIKKREQQSASPTPTPQPSTPTPQPQQHWEPCMACGGTGLCTYCQGKGKSWYGNSYETCIICYGRMHCMTCWGRKGEYVTY